MIVLLFFLFFCSSLSYDFLFVFILRCKKPRAHRNLFLFLSFSFLFCFELPIVGWYLQLIHIPILLFPFFTVASLSLLLFFKHTGCHQRFPPRKGTYPTLLFFQSCRITFFFPLSSFLFCLLFIDMAKVGSSF